MPHNNNQSGKVSPNTSFGLLIEEKLGKVWMRVISFLVAALVGLGGHLYSTMNTRISVLEDKVVHLQQDKVSRAEFKEEMTQLRTENTNNMQNILTRIDAQTTRMEAQMRETVSLLKYVLDSKK